MSNTTEFLTDQVDEVEYVATGGYLGDPAAIARNQARGQAVVNYFSALAHSKFGTKQQGYLLAEGLSWVAPAGAAGKVLDFGADTARIGGRGGSIIAGKGLKFFTAAGVDSSAQTALRSRVLSNIAESSAARETTGFPVLSAKIDQMSGGYLPDAWEMTTLHKDDLVYGGLPGSSAYFTDKNAILDSAGDRNILYKNLQVRLNPERGAYRPNIGIYQLLNDARVPTSMIKANPALGPGGEVQFFIGTGASSKLTLLNEIELREFYEQTLSTHRPGY